MPNAVTVQQVTVRRPSRTLLNEVSFGAPEGSVTVLLGPNGAGKTTVLRTLLGLETYTGSIEVGGTCPRTMDRVARSRLFGYVPQRSRLNAPFTVEAVVEQGVYRDLPWSGRGTQRLRARVDDAMTTCHVDGLRHRAFTTLSGGEQQRVLIARALATDAPVLLLDEPTASLDVGHALDVYALMRALRDVGKTVIVSLHQLGDARKIGDSCVLLDAGKVAAVGLPHEVVSAQPIAEVYGVRLIEDIQPGFDIIAGGNRRFGPKGG